MLALPFTAFHTIHLGNCSQQVIFPIPFDSGFA